MVNIDSGYDLNVHKAAPYILAAKDLWLGHIYIVAMNKDRWNALDKAEQDAIKKTADIAYRQLGAVMDNSWQTQLTLIRQSGADIRELPKADVVQWQQDANAYAEQERWASEQETQGQKNMSGVLQKLRQLITKYSS